jgi:hypothetical protein
MRKEYGNIFTGKYYWEYNPNKSKSIQALCSKKSYSHYLYYFTCYSRFYPLKIIEAFKKDVDAHFAKLERDKLFFEILRIVGSWTIAEIFIKDVINGVTTLDQLRESCKPIIFTNEPKTMQTFTEKPTGGNMKLEIAHEPLKEEPKFIISLESNHHEKIKTLFVRNMKNEKAALISLTEDGRILLHKMNLQRHGFEVEYTA